MNDATTAANLSVVVTISSSGVLPNFLEAKAGTGTWACSAYFDKPGSSASYTCTGTVAAASSGVITVSSGSNIVGTVGQTLVGGVVVNPSGYANGIMAAYS